MKKLNVIYESLLKETTKFRTIAYHGSEIKFDKFSDEFVGGEDANDLEGPGIYFTTSKEGAGYYGNFIHQVELSGNFLDAKTPSDSVDVEELIGLMKVADNWEMMAQNWAEDPESGVFDAAYSSIDYNDNEKDVFLQVWIEFYRHEPIQFVRNMVKLGYDGIITEKDDGSKHIIVYNLNSIKLSR